MSKVQPALTGVLSLTLLAGLAHAWPGTTTAANLSSTADAAAPALQLADLPEPAADSKIFEMVDRDLFSRLPQDRQQMLLSFARSRQYQCDPVAVCFTPDTPEDVVHAFLATAAYGPRFNAGTRWGPTAMDPSSSGQLGARTILTYSFVPDGTNVPDGVGEGAGVSNLFSYMNGIYGSPAAWQAVYAQVFARWHELTGITYVYEPNDDGADMFDSPGVAGVRGDLRLAGKFIDGNSGILAYNYFPQSGDMVIDTGDNFFTNTSGNSLALRNVLAHEHGHGMGLFHECPVDQTKLMEPFISTNYDGPRHDDIRGSQSLYGDSLEPNNTPADATNLGALPNNTPVTVGVPAAPVIEFGSRASISVDSDEDYFRFSLPANRLVSATLHPIGLIYDDTFQSGNCTVHSGNCCPGTLTNSATQVNIDLDIRDASGNTVLITAGDAGYGQDDTIRDFCLPAGTYYARVFPHSGVEEAQLYTLTLLADTTTVRIRPTDDAPAIVAPGIVTNFTVSIPHCGENILDGSAALRYRLGTSGPFLSAPLTPLAGGALYSASLPALSCDQSIQYYLQVQGVAGTVAVSPAGAPAAFYTAQTGAQVLAFSDNFETDQGWTVVNEAGLTDGAWERGIPAGEGGRYDPVADFDGSGNCFLTANRIGNSDVDGGITRVLSPTISLAGAKSAAIAYARWFRDSIFDNDRFTAEVSNNNGATWTLLESVPDVQGWNLVSYPINIPLTGQMRFRFSASDVNPQSVAEAGLDAVSVTGVFCTNPPPACDPDVNQDGVSDQGDVDYLINVVAGGGNPNNANPDFNNDGVADQGDVDALINVIAGGQCP